jgi:tellurite resistance-related uncharacterized protein
MAGSHRSSSSSFGGGKPTMTYEFVELSDQQWALLALVCFAAALLVFAWRSGWCCFGSSGVKCHELPNAVGPRGWGIPLTHCAYKETARFSASTIPGPLLKRHNTRRNTWALVHVASGALAYTVLPDPEHGYDGPEQTFTIRAGQCGLIKPQVWHYIAPVVVAETATATATATAASTISGDAKAQKQQELRCHVEFWAVPKPDKKKQKKEN